MDRSFALQTRATDYFANSVAEFLSKVSMETQKKTNRDSLWSRSVEAVQLESALFKARQNVPLFGRSKKICRLLSELVAMREPAAILAVASWLFDSDQAIEESAAAGVAQLLPLLPSLELLNLGARLGNYPYGYVNERWSQVTPDQVSNLLADTSNVSVLCLFSLHPSGYVRQAAVRALAEIQTGEELRYLLIRQNDWVPVIAEEAQATVLGKLTEAYLDYFVGETELLFHMLQCKRQDLSDTVSRYVDIMIKPKHRNRLEETIGNSTGRAGRKFVDHIFAIEGSHLKDSVIAGFSSTDEVIRTKSLKHAGNCLSKGQCNEVIDRLTSDRFIPARLEALELKAKHSDASNDVWQNALFDKSRAVRETAIFYLKKANIDVAAIYRAQLAESPSSFPALSGLVTAGDLSDIETYQRYLKSPFARRRAEAIRGIGIVGSKADKSFLMEMLADQSARVVRAAEGHLKLIAKSLDSDQLYNRIEACVTPMGVKTILGLLLDKGRWPAMHYLIRAAASSNETSSECAKQRLRYTFSLNRVFTQPTLQQRAKIQVAIGESWASFDQPFLRELKGYLEVYGFSFES